MLLERLIYEYRVVGSGVKDGKRFTKYQKVPRFRSRHRRLALMLLAASIAAIGALYVVTRLPSSPQSIPTAPVGAGPEGG